MLSPDSRLLLRGPEALSATECWAVRGGPCRGQSLSPEGLGSVGGEARRRSGFGVCVLWGPGRSPRLDRLHPVSLTVPRGGRPHWEQPSQKLDPLSRDGVKRTFCKIPSILGPRVPRASICRPVCPSGCRAQAQGDGSPCLLSSARGKAGPQPSSPNCTQGPEGTRCLPDTPRLHSQPPHRVLAVPTPSQSAECVPAPCPVSQDPRSAR